MDPSNLQDNEGYYEDQGQGQEQPPENKQKQQQNPSISFYKPRKNFNASDSKTVGHALQIDLSTKMKCCFLNTAAQNAAMGSNKVFNWQNKLAFKLNRNDICTLLSTLEFWSPESSLTHKNQGKTTIFKVTRAENITDDWAVKSINEGKLSKHAISTRLSQSVDGQQGYIAHTLMLQPHEAIELREFLKWSLWKLFATT